MTDFNIDWDTLPRAADNSYIPPAITELPRGWNDLPPEERLRLYVESEQTTRSHYAVVNRNLQDRSARILQMRNDGLLRSDQQQTVAVTLPIDPLWAQLPLLELTDADTIYPWCRVFESLVNKPTISLERRLEYFLTFPSSAPGTTESATPLLVMDHIEQSYLVVRNAFLREYGFQRPVSSLLASMVLKVPSIKTTKAWVQTLSAVRLELIMACSAHDIQYTELDILSVGIVPYSTDQKQRLHRALASKAHLPRVFEVVVSMFPAWPSDVTHNTTDVPLMQALARYNPTAGRPKREQRSSRRQPSNPNHGNRHGALPVRQPLISKQQTHTATCGNCGSATCPRGKACPAKTIQCTNCQKTGHLHTVCRSARNSADVKM